jgi:hypothetical protein
LLGVTVTVCDVLEHTPSVVVLGNVTVYVIVMKHGSETDALKA